MDDQGQVEPGPARLLRRERAGGAPETARRGRRVNLAFNEAEYAVVRAAAAPMAAGAWASQTVLAVARGLVVPVPTGERETLRALTEARTAVNRIGVNLNQISAAVNAAAAAGEDPSTAAAGGQVAAVLARVEVALHRLDAATVSIAQWR